MRLAGPVVEKSHDPESWITAVRKSGYTAANIPLGCEASDTDIAAYVKAAKAADVVIAEVGAWSNPIDADTTKARAAIVKCQRHLDLAERSGSRCCVNIVGSRNPAKWDEPH